MSADLWAAVAAIAAGVTAAITGYIAWANHSTICIQAQAVDFDSCLDVVERIAEAQRRVSHTELGSKDRDFEFRELLNLMEALALLEISKSSRPTTRHITENFLVEAFAYLQSQPELYPFLQSSLTSAETFSGLVTFAGKHRKRIDALAIEYAHQAEATASVDAADGDQSNNAKSLPL